MKMIDPKDLPMDSDISFHMEATADKKQFILVLKSRRKMTSTDAMMAMATLLGESGIPIKISKRPIEPT